MGLLQPLRLLEAGCSRGEIAVVAAIEIELGAKLHRERRRTFADLKDAETPAFRQGVKRRTDLPAQHFSEPHAEFVPDHLSQQRRQ